MPRSVTQNSEDHILINPGTPNSMTAPVAKYSPTRFHFDLEIISPSGYGSIGRKPSLSLALAFVWCVREGFSRRLITYQRGTCFGLYEDAHVAVQMMIRVIKVTIGKGGGMGGSI